MNPTTLLLLQLTAPAFLILGIGMVLNKKYYTDSFETFIKNPHLLMWAACMNLVIGPAILINHNLWGTPQEIIVSVIGVMATLKGLHMALAPKHWMKKMPKLINDSFMTYGSFVLVIIGIYMMWSGYFA
ncbi:MAG: hypothetical protein P8J32_08890 [bacterium]|jgi:hypothetical protein|nr:hypothetical protein [bacterium]